MSSCQIHTDTRQQQPQRLHRAAEARAPAPRERRLLQPPQRQLPPLKRQPRGCARGDRVQVERLPHVELAGHNHAHAEGERPLRHPGVAAWERLPVRVAGH